MAAEHADARLCVIHIGAPKTGTTFLQKVFFLNREILKQQGWLYPDVSLRGYGHHDLAFLLAGGYPEWAAGQDRPLAELQADLATAVRTEHRAMLLSSENFYLYRQPQRLHDCLVEAGVLPGYRLKIVVYVREQGAAHESWYNQTIKAQGYTHSVADCVAEFRDLWDYRLQLEAWAHVFGADRLIVRRYDEGDYVGGGLLSDFCAATGLDAAAIQVDEPTVNSGLNRDALEFQRLVNALPLSHVERRRFHRQLIELTARTRGQALFSELPALDAEQRAQIRLHYADGNAEVAARYLCGGPLFAEAADAGGAAPGYAGLDAAAMARLFGWLIIRSRAE